MLAWSEETVRFMTWASEYGDYHRRLAAWMLPHLGPDAHICDAGCGLGYLSLALSPHAGHVTAADRSETALAAAREVCARRNVRNVSFLSGDLFSHSPERPYDAMVFCFFGSMEEVSAIARRQCRGTVFVFKKNYLFHRFSVEAHPTGRDSFHAGTRWLRARRIPFFADTLELEMGQPFPDWGAARRFFELYSRDADKGLITEAFLRGKVMETARTDFPLYLPHRRRVGCLRFSSSDL